MSVVYEDKKKKWDVMFRDMLQWKLINIRLHVGCCLGSCWPASEFLKMFTNKQTKQTKDKTAQVLQCYSYSVTVNTSVTCVWKGST